MTNRTSGPFRKACSTLAATIPLLLAVLPGLAHGAQEIPTDKTGGIGERGPADPAELEAFIDGLMVSHLDVYHTAGATVSVVKDGELFFAKGYGYADVDSRVEVAAEETMFRIGSISKLFVWTAVMQLVEEGKLDLNADINTYLADLRIPDAYGQPVTMTHLMTHTPGFEDHVIGLFGRDEASLRPLNEVLAQETPARVRPPGEVSAYSNHGTGMAARIVEVISGTSWDDYVEEKILGPLGMDRTTFRQPVPERIHDGLSNGYTYSERKFDREDYEFVPLAPAGAAASTATDMAKFMIAHLHNGQYGNARILQEATARRMHQELFRHAPGVNPMAHGFIDVSSNDQWVIGHGGDTFWFHSMLALLPEHDVGLFVSYNSQEGSQGTGAFLRAFMDRYYPVDDPPELIPPSDFDERAQRFVGSYRVNRYSHSTFAKLGAINAVTVSSSGDGALLTNVTGRIRWIEVEPLTFREEDGHRRLVFREDDRGRITHMFLGNVQVVAFEKLSGYETPRFQLIILVAAVALFVLTVVLWPTAAIVRLRHRVSLPPERRLPRAARLLAWSASVFFLAFAVGALMLFRDPTEIVYGVPSTLKAVLTLPIAAAALTGGAWVHAFLIWKNSRGGVWVRLYYTLLALAFLTSLWQLHYWNLLGLRY